MRGDTRMGRTPAGEDSVHSPFWTGYGLVSVPIRRHRLSVRYDRFETEDDDGLPVLDPNEESGNAWTGCYAFEPGPHLRLAVEVVRAEYDRTERVLQGQPRHGQETLLQASWRIWF